MKLSVKTGATIFAMNLHPREKTYAKTQEHFVTGSKMPTGRMCIAMTRSTKAFASTISAVQPVIRATSILLENTVKIQEKSARIMRTIFKVSANLANVRSRSVDALANQQICWSN